MYTDNETLCGGTLARNPNSFLANNNIGVNPWSKRDSWKRQSHYFQKALQSHPGDPKTHNDYLGHRRSPRLMAIMPINSVETGT